MAERYPLSAAEGNDTAVIRPGHTSHSQVPVAVGEGVEKGGGGGKGSTSKMKAER